MRVSVVSEQLLSAELVAASLRQEGALEVTSVVGGATSLDGPSGVRALGATVLAFAALTPPDSGLLRRVLEGEGEGAAAISRRVLVIADLFGCIGLARALQIGARGYVGPWERAEVLARRVLQAGQGILAVPPGPADGLRAALRIIAREATVARCLTDTDIEVMRWLSRGETAREIAARLNVSEPAIRHRLRKIMIRLEVRNEKELSAVAATAGLYEPRTPVTV